jgi:PAS domain S-box-containing protein
LVPVPISNPTVTESPVEILRLKLAELETVGARLAEAEQQRCFYHQLVEHSLGLMCSHDLSGVLLNVNPAAAASLGYLPQEGTGHNLREFLAPPFQVEFDAYLDRMRQNSSDSGYMRLIAKNGQERIWMYRNAKYEEQGQAPIVLGHALDVTERMRAESSLRESEEKYRQLFEEAPVGYYEMDRSGILQRVNRALTELLGWSAEDLIQRHVGEFVVAAERERYGTERLEHSTAPGDSRHYVLSFLCKDYWNALRSHNNERTCGRSGA